MKTVRFLVVLLFSVLIAGKSFSQTYPVEALLSVKPPYSLYLSDYVAPGSDKLNISLFLKDLTKTNYPVKLRLTIEGEGITIRTLDHVTFDPIYLNGGELLELSGSDLTQYFNPKNLSFQGIDKNSYTKTNRLPEGIYRISIEVLDLTKKFVVSNKATHTAWFFLNNPPIWNLPAQNAIVKATFPQNVFFQWLPMNRTSLNSAFTTEYEFTLVEIYPINRNPNDAILSQAPIYQATTLNTSLVYDDMMPALIPGRKYAARLKGYDKGGLDLFKNNGFSEVLVFTFGEECKAPSAIRSEVISPSRVKLTWIPLLNHTEFVVRYRESGKPDAQWFEQTATIPEVSINELKPNTEYEFQVMGLCESLQGDFSSVQRFTTVERPKSEYDLSCGYNETPREITNFVPLLVTSPGSVFRVGKFDMEVTEVMGGNGIFSGRGNIFVPYLFSTIKVQFQNIKVNENYEVFEGEVIALKTGLSLLSASDLATIAVEERRDSGLDICLPPDDGSSTNDDPVTFNPGDVLIDLGTIKIHKGDTIIVNGQTVIADENTKFNPGDKVTVNGQEYTIGPTGDAKSTGSSTGTGTASVSQQLGKEVKLNIKPILEELQSENKTSKNENTEAVKSYGDEIKAIIQQEKLIREVITGKDEELIKEGMSKKLRIPEENYGNSTDPIVLVYQKHRNLYESDSSLYRNKRKEYILKQLLSKDDGKDKLEVRLDSIANLVIQDMTSLNPEQVKIFEEKGKDANKALEEYIKENLKKRLDTKSAEPIEGIGFNLIDLPNFLAYNKAYRGGYSLLTNHKNLTKANNDTATFITPAVRAHALHRIILEGDRRVGDMNPMVPIDLPIGLVQQKSGIDYIVAIENMVFTPREAWFDAFMSTEVPQTGKKLAFAGSHIRFGPLGITGASNVKLLLMKDIPMRLSNQVKLTIKSENAASFIEFDCEGFKSLSITGEFEFCEEILVPDSPDGEAKEGRVKARFNATISDWNDLIARVEIDPFQVKGLEGVGFYVSEAVIDMSDRNNPASIIFPKDYNSPYFIEGNKTMWQGFYLREASVRLPRHFKDNTKQGTRIELGVRNLIIDNMGFTGEVFAKGLFPKENGDMDGWAYSLDSLAVGVQCNQIRYARFNGAMTIPAFKEENEFNYTALINPGNEYIFTVSPAQNLSMPLWKVSKVDLYSSSRIIVRLSDGKFLPKAILNGKLTIGSKADADTSQGPKLSLADITFEQLQIASVEPYMQIGSFSFGSEQAEQKLSNFPVTIRNIGVIQRGKDVGIGFTLRINLMSTKDNGFGGEASLAVMGTMDERTARKKWVFKSVDLSAASINIDQGAYKIWGSIFLFKQDQIYGSGFKGNVGAEFKPGIKVEASALFGNVNSERYWYADAMASFPTGIPVFPGFGIYGFGGGAYYRMKQQGFNEAAISIGR
ncbi:MAG: fibronectin type III domain-containing protein, partial [Cytophagaceae bacterium]|nr:fibronectin type III domain-containing protein [Cytophagaceae bacterium]